ncbi:hypothetical protein LSTR_LSTR005566 [Laodelphax striatellus]|uniref:Uncharacterized protein n=1 Tax=Laodelphax striatellus TaxID=195883 RepID=A0A482WXG1_LAOST|nr:hypothetical protein LSTR_LSTR005566 [Laodelphax striatellus]
MRKLLLVNFVLIMVCIIGNVNGMEFWLFPPKASNPIVPKSADSNAPKSGDSSGSKSGDSNAPKSGDSSGPKSGDTSGTKSDNSGTKTADCKSPGTTGNGAANPNDVKTPSDDKLTKVVPSAEEMDAFSIMNRMSPEVVPVEDELVRECVHDKDGHDHHDDSKCPKDQPSTKDPTSDSKGDKATSDSNEGKEGKEEHISVSPKPRMIRNGNGIVFKYEVDFKKPLFHMKGFRGGLAAGFITPHHRSEEFESITTYEEDTIKIFMIGEFGLVRDDNTTFGITGEIFLEIKHGNGEFRIGAGVKVAWPGKKYEKYEGIGNTMKESPPFCVTIPQLAGIRFCQVAFDFTFRTNYTASACIQTEIKHLLCPIPLVTIQYHCINFSRWKLHMTKTTRKTGVINPKEVITSFSRRTPSSKGKNCNGKQAKPSSSTKTSKTKGSDKLKRCDSSKKASGSSPTWSSNAYSSTTNSKGGTTDGKPSSKKT